MEPFTVYKWIRGRVPEWYVRRCFDAMLKLNGDHFRGHAPFTLQLAAVALEQRVDGTLVEFTFTPCGPTYYEQLGYDDVCRLVSLREAIAELHGRLDPRSLGLS